MANRICVSIPTDDGETVKLGHFGDAKYYYHYVYTEKGWVLERIVENPYTGEHGHDGESAKRPRIYGLNRGCTHIVATAFGPGGQQFMEKKGLVVVKVKPGTSIRDALGLVEAMAAAQPSSSAAGQAV